MKKGTAKKVLMWLIALHGASYLLWMTPLFALGVWTTVFTLLPIGVFEIIWRNPNPNKK